MTIEAFVESHAVIKQYDCLYYLYPKLWGKYKAITSSLSHPDRWSGYIKYLNNNNQVSDEIKNLLVITCHWYDGLFRNDSYVVGFIASENIILDLVENKFQQ